MTQLININLILLPLPPNLTSNPNPVFNTCTNQPKHAKSVAKTDMKIKKEKKKEQQQTFARAENPRLRR